MPSNNETGRGIRFNAIKDLIADNLKLRFQGLIVKPALKDEEKFVTLQVGKTVWEQVQYLGLCCGPPHACRPQPVAAI